MMNSFNGLDSIRTPKNSFFVPEMKERFNKIKRKESNTVLDELNVKFTSDNKLVKRKSEERKSSVNLVDVEKIREDENNEKKKLIDDIKDIEIKELFNQLDSDTFDDIGVIRGPDLIVDRLSRISKKTDKQSDKFI